MVDRNLVVKTRGGSYSTEEGMMVTVPPSGFDWRTTVGSIPGVIDPFGESSTQQWPLGTKLEYGEQIFRYCKNGAVTGVAGSLYQAVVPLAGHINEVCGVAAVGDVTIAFTPNTDSTDDLAANELQDGQIFIYNGAGEGHSYKILSHPAIAGAVSGTLTLADPIRVVNAAVATVMHNRYRAVIVHPSPPTAIPVGWFQQAVTANYFCWILTKGPTTMLIDGTVVMGGMVRPSEDDDGAVAALDFDEAADADHGTVGWVMEIGADAGGANATFGFGIAQLE